MGFLIGEGGQEVKESVISLRGREKIDRAKRGIDWRPNDFIPVYHLVQTLINE